MRKGATIIEVYKNGSSGGPTTLEAYDPEKRSIGFYWGSKE